jgi:hypothetical protein
MTNTESWVPEGVDMERPNAARMYDYFLGGAHNFQADRAAAKAVLAIAPQVRDAARANRDFLHRAVRFALDHGVRQFLDLGSGIPTVGNVHEVVHKVDPAARVVYVDCEPVAVAHSRALLTGVDTVQVVNADIRDIVAVLDHPATRALIDFGQPVAVLMVSVLHFVPGDITGMVAELREAMAPGSYMAISHASSVVTTAQTDAVQQLYAQTPTPLALRSREQICALFGDLALVPPDPSDAAVRAELVPVTRWRPAHDGDPPPLEEPDSPFIAGFLAGVGHKPAPPHTLHTAKDGTSRNRDPHLALSARAPLSPASDDTVGLTPQPPLDRPGRPVAGTVAGPMLGGAGNGDHHLTASPSACRGLLEDAATACAITRPDITVPGPAARIVGETYDLAANILRATVSPDGGGRHTVVVASSDANLPFKPGNPMGWHTVNHSRFQWLPIWHDRGPLTLEVYATIARRDRTRLQPVLTALAEAAAGLDIDGALSGQPAKPASRPGPHTTSVPSAVSVETADVDAARALSGLLQTTFARGQTAPGQPNAARRAQVAVIEDANPFGEQP